MTYHSWKPLLDRGAIISIAEGDRGVGKSYPMLLRAMRRMVRNHRSCVWLRRTDAEVKDWLSAFGSAKWRKLAQQARIDPDKLRRQGNLIFYNKGDEKRAEWVKLLRVGAVSGWAHFRDTDDPAEEIIYLDEAFATVEAHRRYVGNEVEHCLDILKSLRRGDGSDMRLLLAGNAERAFNPWLDYFGISQPKINSGILLLHPTKHAAEGVIAYERIRRAGAGDDLDALVRGTAIGDFLDGKPKGASSAMISPIPRGASHYANVDFGRRLSLWLSDDGTITVSLRHDSRTVLRSVPNGDRNSIILTADVRKRFTLLRRAWQSAKVRFDSYEAQEWGIPAISKLL